MEVMRDDNLEAPFRQPGGTDSVTFPLPLPFLHLCIRTQSLQDPPKEYCDTGSKAEVNFTVENSNFIPPWLRKCDLEDSGTLQA